MLLSTEVIAMTDSHLTKKEYQIMKVLWNSDRPLLVSEIAKEVESVATHSLHPLIKKLIDKGYIKTVGYMMVSKAQSRLYTPAISVDEHAAMQLKDLSKITNKAINVKDFLAYFTKTKKGQDEKILKEIQEFVNSFEQKD